MSQQPSPYSVPYQYPAGYPYDPAQQLLAPARRAGLLMIILGSLIFAYSLCNGIISFIFTADQLLSQNPMLTAQSTEMLPPDTIKTMAVVFSGIMAATGIALIGLGIPVRRNSGGAIVAALVLTCIVTLVVALLVLISAVGGVAVPVMFALACLLIVPLALFVLQLVWLVQAARAGAQVRAAQMQYQSQYWQYQQQQQMYTQQGGYGYPQPPPPQSPPNQSGERPDDPAAPR